MATHPGHYRKIVGAVALWVGVGWAIEIGGNPLNLQGPGRGMPFSTSCRDEGRTSKHQRPHGRRPRFRFKSYDINHLPRKKDYCSHLTLRFACKSANPKSDTPCCPLYPDEFSVRHPITWRRFLL